MPVSYERRRLLIPPAFACTADIGATLLGQPSAYWAGNRAAVIEYNPVARVLLEIHPILLPLVAVVGYLVLAFILTTWRNLRLAYALAFATTFAQSAAAAGWMLRWGASGWVVAVALLICAERLLAWANPRTPTVPLAPTGSG